MKIMLIILKNFRESLSERMQIPFFIGYYCEDYAPQSDVGYVYATSMEFLPYENIFSYNVIVEIFIYSSSFTFVDGIGKNYLRALGYIKKFNAIFVDSLWKSLGIVTIKTDITNVRNDLMILTFNLGIKTKKGFLK